jgi:hypothetical protein
VSQDCFLSDIDENDFFGRVYLFDALLLVRQYGYKIANAKRTFVGK